MNTKQLKQKILFLAITGRLVPQDPRDEPASELLHRINPKATPLETDQPLPEGWVWCKPSDLGTFGMGKTILRKDLSSEGIPVYSATMGDEPFGRIKKEDNKLKLTKGDLVIPARGTLGYVKFVRDEEATSTQTTIYVKVKDKEVSSFLYHYYNACRNTIFESSGTSTPQVTIEMLFKHFIPLPPLSEQRRIANAVELWFAKIDQLEHDCEALSKFGKQVRKKLLTSAIAGRLVPQDPNDEPASELLHRINPKATPLQDDVPYEIPDSWCWVKHNDILEISGGSQPPKSNFIDSPKEGYVRLYQIRDYGKTPAPVYVPKNMVSKFTKKGDILLARYGASIGKIFWAEDGAYNVAMAKVIPLYKPELISKKYLYLFYCGEIFQSCIRNHSRSAQAGFNKSDLNELLIPIPPLAEQKRIVEKLESMFAVLDNLDALTA